MHEECSFCTSTFLKDISDNFVSASRVSYPLNLTKEAPNLTRFPPHVLHMAEMEALRVKFDALQSTMKHEINTTLDDRGIGGSDFYTNNIMIANAG